MNECMTQEDAEKMSNQQATNILKPLRDMMRDQHGCPISDAYFALDKAIKVLTAEERKKGEWIDFSMSIKGIPTEACGECGEWSLGMGKKYCPCCGSRNMRGEEDG